LEIMNILEAYDLTGSFRDAGELAGCSHHTAARYVQAREEGRLVLPLLDKTQASVWAAVDVSLRRMGGVPAYLLTDNEKTVTVEHVAGVPVRNPGAVELGRHPDGREPAWRVRELRGAGGGLRRVLRAGQRPPAPGHAGPRRRCSPTSGPGCTRCRRSRSPRRSA
jgi:hypothetical protein